MQSSLLCALALVPVVGGCSEMVNLGSECPPNISVCPDGPLVPPVPGAAEGPVTGLLDGGVAIVDTAGRDGSLGADASVPVDGNGEGTGGTVPTLPALLNRSFELTQGGPGDVTAVSLPSFTSIAPWYTCQPVGQGSTGPLSAVRAENTLGLGSVDAGTAIGATDADTFVSIRYFGNVLQVPLIQHLVAPMAPGVRYGFAVDVRTTSLTAHLSLRIKGGNDCLGITQQPEVLATTTPIAPGTWQRVCVSFQPKASYNVIGLQAVSTLPLSDDMLLVDNLREAIDCP